MIPMTTEVCKGSTPKASRFTCFLDVQGEWMTHYDIVQEASVYIAHCSLHHVLIGTMLPQASCCR